MKKLAALSLFVLMFTLSTAWATTTLNLLSAGNTATGTGAIGGDFRVDQISPQSTGTGVIDSFLRIQQDGNERGYNTSLGTPLDDKSGNFTRALSLSEIPTVNISGTLYRQFLLDINQSVQNRLSLNQIQIFQSATDQLHNSLVDATASKDAIIGFGGGATEVFRMNNANPLSSNYEIQLDYSLNAGSGSGDMFLYVRNSDFNAANGAFVILFSQFGAPPGAYSSNDGFEEWAVVKASGTPCIGDCVVNTPEPVSILLFGTVLAGTAVLWKRRRLA